jgi:hypothetical protein
MQILELVLLFFILYYRAPIRWACYSYWWWLQFNYNYEHIITQQYISAMESSICAKLILTNRCPACVHIMKRPFSSEEWHIAIGPWFILDVCCFVNLCPWVLNCHALDGNQLFQLRGYLWSVRWFKVRADLNMLNHLKVIWSTEPIWNICIICTSPQSLIPIIAILQKNH